MSIQKDDPKRDGTGIPKGWDHLKFTWVKEGDAAVCAVPFAVPIKQEFKFKQADDIRVFHKNLPKSALTIKKGLRCKPSKLKFKTIKDNDTLETFVAEFESGKRKKLKCHLKRREVGGNFAKVKCWGILTDVLGGSKDIHCEGYNIYGDRIDGKGGEILSENWRDFIHENVGECKRLKFRKRLITPANILEKSRELLDLCNRVILGSTDAGIPKTRGKKDPIRNSLAPPAFRAMESRAC